MRCEKAPRATVGSRKKSATLAGRLLCMALPAPSGAAAVGESGTNPAQYRLRIVCGIVKTLGLVAWSLCSVVMICHAMPDIHDAEHTRLSPGLTISVFADRSSKLLLLLFGVLLAMSFLSLFGRFRSRKKLDSSSDRPRSSMTCANHVLADLETGHFANASGATGIDSLRAGTDSDSDEDFLSCEEDGGCDGETTLGMYSLGGVLVEKAKLPVDADKRDYNALLVDIHARCFMLSDLSLIQALRLALGLNFDAPVIVEKWREVCEWREKYHMAKERDKCLKLQLPSAREAISFPHEQVIYSKAFVVSPCALVARTGEPVTVWFVGSGSPSAASVPISQIEEWGRSVFEYAAAWAEVQSASTGQLLGQVQVFDMAGVGLRQLANTSLHERFKHALGCGGNYVELVSRIYVINASWAFSKTWNVIKPLISPRTASKVIVSTDVPKELFEFLTRDSASKLPGLLRDRRSSDVQRPPRNLDGHV